MKLINAVSENGLFPINKKIRENLLKLQATSSTSVRIYYGFNHQNLDKFHLQKIFIGTKLKHRNYCASSKCEY